MTTKPNLAELIGTYDDVIHLLEESEGLVGCVGNTVNGDASMALLAACRLLKQARGMLKDLQLQEDANLAQLPDGATRRFQRALGRMINDRRPGML